MYTRDTHQYFMKASPVRPKDFIEFFAEIDLLVAKGLALTISRLTGCWVHGNAT